MKVESRKKMKFFDKISNMEKRKSLKLLISGFIIFIIFGLIAQISVSIANNASIYYYVNAQKAYIDYINNLISYEDYIRLANEYELTALQMEWQEIYIVNIARVFIALAFILMILGFLSISINDRLDNRTKLHYLLSSGAILVSIISIVVIAGITPIFI